MTWEDVHQITIREITIGLIKLGILKKSIEYSIKNGLYKRYFMHGTGHWVGLDVHDVGDRNEIFKPGMIITVEPGIYISANDNQVEKKWRGIGIRIEDDVLITQKSCKVLTAKLPKRISEIEKLCA